MDEIAKTFASMFAPWGITLPEDDIAARRRGKLVQRGWVILYLFGSDEKGDYLDFYAVHRMSADRHERVYGNGSVEELPSVESMRSASSDPAEDKRLDAAFTARNREIAAMLEKKGFGPPSDVPGFVAINRHLNTGRADPTP